MFTYFAFRQINVDSDILRSVIDALFLATRNYHKERQVKNIRRNECYGCSIYSRSVPRAVYALTHTFQGVVYTDQRGYSNSVRSLVKAVVSLELRTGR